ncbi:lipoprotein [Xanthobacter sp. V2C-8]|uniref:LPS translocon maturation chaperone LptM n=1 Tax=Xanthobacter albus TaxID=3119929 RepID=UPI00372B3072
MFRLTLPLALVAAFALAACGVKGPLEPPPGAPVATPQAQVAPPPNVRHSAGALGGSATDMVSNSSTHAAWEKDQRGASGDPLKGIARPDQPFILDGLL